MQTPFLILGALVAVGVGAGALWLVSCAKPLTIEGELAKAPAGDRQALDALLQGTGLTPAQLTPIGAGVTPGFGVLQHHQHAVAVEDGRIVELRLSDVPLPHPESLTQLTGLQALWLSGNHLTALPDLTPLKALVYLNLTGNPGVVVTNPNPAKLTTKLDTDAAASAEPGHPSNWVHDLPPRKGKPGRGTIEGLVKQGAYSVTGTLSSLEGACQNFNIPGNYNSGGAGGTTLELSVGKGRVRGYLQYVPAGDASFKKVDGFIYAEAQPGKPGKVQGIRPAFSSDDKYTVTLESLEGEASEIRYHLSRE